MYCSEIYRHTYSDDIEENIFSDSDYFTTITIKIHEQEYDENFETINEFEIGIIEVLLYDVESAINNYENVITIADSQNQEVSDAMLHVFNSRNNGLKDKYRSMEFTENVIYLERLFIKPEFRKLGYAKVIMNNINKILSRLVIARFACMVMIPAAFEYANPVDYKELLNDDQIPDGKKLTEKLYRFYKKCGFKTIPNSSVLYKICD